MLLGFEVWVFRAEAAEFGFLIWEFQKTQDPKMSTNHQSSLSGPLSKLHLLFRNRKTVDA